MVLFAVFVEYAPSAQPPKKGGDDDRRNATNSSDDEDVDYSAEIELPEITQFYPSKLRALFSQNLDGEGEVYFNICCQITSQQLSSHGW